MKKIAVLIGICLCLLTACGIEHTDDKKVKDLDFTVMEEESIPNELKDIIDQKKDSEFKLTYEDGNFLYIAVGYGTQKTGGYSIAVNELYLTSNAVYINTNLIGPSKGENISEVASYPYIVVKLEYLDKSVVFE